MRGTSDQQIQSLVALTPEDLVPREHPIRHLALTDRGLISLTAVPSRRKWSGLTEEPGIEKAVQIPARNLLSHSHKILGCYVASGMAGHILTQRLEKRLVADFACAVRGGPLRLSHRRRR